MPPNSKKHPNFVGPSFKNILKKRKKQALRHILAGALYFCRTFHITTIRTTNMDNIQNTRGKGYCILYIFMGLFFLTALILMLYLRNGVLDFPR
jgi:hypothetical protein